MSRFFLLVLVAGLPPSLRADVIHVPGDQPTIQAALDTAQGGDTVLVSPGVYFERIEFPARSISLESVAGPAETTIDGEGLGRVVRFVNGVGPGASLAGFTIRGGSAEMGGGVLFESGSEPLVQSCWFEDNVASTNGADAYCAPQSFPLFMDCRFEGATGTSVKTDAASPTFVQCSFENVAGCALANSNGGVFVVRSTFTNNESGLCNDNGEFASIVNSRFSGNLLHGVDSVRSVGIDIVNSVFERNGVAEVETEGAAVRNIYYTEARILNCRFSGNSSRIAGALRIREESTVAVEHCTFEGNSTWFGSGGAIAVLDADAAISGCVFDGNFASHSAGAVSLALQRQHASHQASVTECVFRNNSAAEWGGAMQVIDDIDATVTFCEFAGNTAGGDGGALFVTMGRPIVSHSVFVNNHADGDGGGIQFNAGGWRLDNLLLNGNSAAGNGGALAFVQNTRISNCTIVGNTASQGAAIYSNAERLKIRNSIIVGHATPPISIEGELLPVFSIIQDGLPGVGNQNGAPIFVDPLGPDGVAGTLDDDYRLAPGSPGIDAGENTLVGQDLGDVDGDGRTDELVPLDLLGNSRFVDASDDGRCIGDLNHNGRVGPADLSRLLAAFGLTEGATFEQGDMTNDGAVDIEDLGLLLSRFGTACRTFPIDMGAYEIR